jgi:hypothetical protein
VGWVKASDQTILTLHKRVITHNTRVHVTHDEHNTWNLHIKVGPVISIEWILYTGLLPVLALRGEISLVAPKSIYIAAGLGIKKISFPFSVHHSSYNTRLLSTKGESAISLMQ